MSTTTSSASPVAVPAALGAFLAIVLACAVAGLVLATGLLTGDARHEPGTPTGPFGVADDVPTSFGFVAVEHAETLTGLTAKQLGGAVHGIGSFVARDKALVQASITLTNDRLKPMAYSPAQFRLRATSKRGKVRRIALSQASIRPGVLQPDAAIDARLSYIAPRDGSALALEFADPGAERPVVIGLGERTRRATAADRAASRHHQPTT